MEIPAVRPTVKAFALAGFWIVFLLAYFQRFPWPGFLTHVFLLALTGVVTASAAGYGALAGSRLWPTPLSRAERILFSITLGYGVLSLAMIVLGLLGGWTRPAAVGLVAVGFAISGRYVYRFTRYVGQIEPLFRLSQPSVAIVIAGVATLFGLLMTFAPITYYDSLVYHLALPQAYARAHGWVALPELIYSAFPQNLEMLWLLGLLIGNDTLVNLIGWVLTLCCVASVYLFSRRYLDSPTAGWAAALLSTMPAFLLLSSGGYVDAGLALYSFLTLYALMLWRDHPHRNTALLAGIFGGLAIGIKYTGALSVAAGLVILLATEGRPLWRRNISHGLIYAGSAYILSLPWMLKNLIVMGNPVFPFFHQWSILKLNPWVGEAAAGYFFHGLTEYEPRSGFQVIKLLWDIAVRGMDFGGGMDALGDLGWALLFGLLPALWLATPLPKVTKLLLGFAVLFYVPWAMSRPVLRFLVPLAPVLAVLSAWAWTKGVAWIPSKLFQGLARIVLVSLLISNFYLFFFTTGILGSFRVLLDLQDRDAYLSTVIRNSYYPASRFMKSLSENSLTYVIGDQRSYYYETPVIVTPVFNRNPLTDWANRASSPKVLVDLLRSRDISHLLINRSEMNRLKSYTMFPFTEKGQKNWNGMVQSELKLVYQDTHCQVFEL